MAAAALGAAASPALANESHSHGHGSEAASGSGSTRGGTTVNTRTASASIAPADGFVTVYAKCEANEVPVNGYWLVDGEEPEGNPKVIYQSSSTGERADGFRVIAAKGSKSIFDPIDPTPITVTAYARCLVVDNSNS